MIHLGEHRYEYQEEANDGILAQFERVGGEKPRVLDVGCGGGALGEAIGARGYEVWGIERHPEAIALAAGRLAKIIRADLSDLASVRAVLKENTFDVLVLSDVLEHVYDPFLTLKSYLEFLRPGGRVLISVPNVAVWTNRLALLFGRFEYADTGLMDRTHIRFFTVKTAKAIVIATGCRIVKVDQTPFFVRAALPMIKRFYGAGRKSIAQSRGYRLYRQTLYPFEHLIGAGWKALFAFRIIIVARKP